MMNNQNLADQLSNLLNAYRKEKSSSSDAYALRSHMVAHADEIIAALRGLDESGCSCLEVYGEDPTCPLHGESAFIKGAKAMRNLIARKFREAGCATLAVKVFCLGDYTELSEGAEE